MTDERLGLPSASGIERVIACPGSVALTKDIPKPEPGSAAIEGTIIHSILEGQKVPDATPDQLWVADKLKEISDKVVKEFSMMIGSDVTLCQAEMRMVLEDKKKVVMTGKPDVIYSGTIGDDVIGLVVDYKTGQIIVPAKDNAQLAALAVMAANRYGFTEVYSAIIQLGGSNDLWHLTGQSIRLWKEKILTALQRSSQPLAPRNAGIHCLYCTGLSVCPEGQGMGLALAKQPSDYQIIDVADLPKLLEAASIAEKVADVIKKKAKDLLSSGVEVPGWKITESDIRYIDDPADAMGSIADAFGHGVAMVCSDVSITKLEKVLKEKQGINAKEVKGKTSAVLGECLKTRTIQKLVRAG
jgi:hypothetical protein